MTASDGLASASASGSAGAAPKRRRGRPPGKSQAITNPSRALGVHHFAFLRSSLLGLDLAVAFARYLEFGESSSDPRHVEHRRTEIFKQILEAGRRLDLTLAPEHKITRLLDLLRSDAPAKPVQRLPTLDEWMAEEGMDPDFWSEAEAISEYQAAHGIDNLEAVDAAAGLADAVAARVGALNFLQTLLAVNPALGDGVDTWFARSVVIRFRNAGILSLADLGAFINVYGYRWYARIKGFGERRAGRVVAWLRSQAEVLQLEIRASVDEGKTVRALRLGVDAGRLVVAPRFGLVPLEQLTLPAALAGEQGTFRSHMANTLEATDDLQAITRWLSRYDEKPSTARSYRKEIERFVLWCTTVQQKPVSSASALDCQAFRAFLAAVPDHWIYPAPVERSDPQWRPFRKQPEPASQKQALVIVQTMFEGLRDAGYLVANPMRAVMKGFSLPHARIDLKRSFTEAEWAHVLLCVADLPAGPDRVRLRCILELLVSSGIRLDELAKAKRSDLRLEAVGDEPETWVLSVVGKRNKQRDVPLANDVVELLDLHAAQFPDGEPETLWGRAQPLVRALQGSVEQWGRGENGEIKKAAVVAQGGGGLSGAGIYAVVKRFFGRAAKTAAAAGLDAARFEAASTHWMRHTFVRQALVDGAPIEVVSELAGHASIATTSIYSSQELARKIQAIRGMRRRTATVE